MSTELDLGLRTYGAMFGVFLAQKLANKPLTIVGDGSQTRDFTYVTDVVQALLEVAKHDINNQIFNIGSGQTISINRIVDLLKVKKFLYLKDQVNLTVHLQILIKLDSIQIGLQLLK